MNTQEMWDAIDPPKKQIIRFYNHAVFKKTESGAKVFKQEIYASMHNQGSNDSISVKATDEMKHEHKDEYSNFLKRQSLDLVGLECLCNCAEARTLNEIGIFSINELAECKKLPILNNLINKAKQILEIRNGKNKETRNSNSEIGQTQFDNNTQRESRVFGGDGIRKREKRSNLIECYPEFSASFKL